MNNYKNKETVIEDIGKIVISLINFKASSRSPFDEVVLYVKETKIEESRQVVLQPEQARKLATALIKGANEVEKQWELHELMILESTLHLSAWEDEGGASGT